MQVVGPNRIKLELNESVFELIKLIKPTHLGDVCSFLEGPLWMDSPPRKYNGRLVSRSYWLINHHLYKVSLRNQVRSKHTYLRVSGRGNVNEITKDEAVEIIKDRTGYVEDSFLSLPESEDPEIPYRTANCDW
jgi:hypothetical protein